MRAYLLLLFSLLALYSCRELVQDEFQEFTPVPTVNSILAVDSIVKVHVSLAGKLDSKKLEYVDNAEVLLFIDGQFYDSLVYTGEGIYSSNKILKPLHIYNCTVSIPGFQTITCTNSFPQPAKILDVEHIEKAGKNEEGMTYPAIKFSFKNNPGEKRYYEVVIRLFEYGNERVAEIYTQTDPVLLNEGLPLALFSNDFINDSVYTMTINYTTGEYGSSNDGTVITKLYPVILELRSVSFEYYQYVRQLYLYETGRYPEFTGGAVTSFPLYSNIKGAYGIFAGYSSFVTDTIFPLHQ